MLKEELNKILENCKINLDWIDECNNISIEDKKRWKIEEIIEENCKCPNCKKIALTGTSLTENLFMCCNCGELFMEEDIIK